MRFSLRFSLALGTILVLSANSSLAIKRVSCTQEVFDSVFSRLQNVGEINTTSLRKELKRVVSFKAEKAFFEELTHVFGELKARDPVGEGMMNVTSTDYSPPFNLVDGRTAKIRVRQYKEKPRGTKNKNAAFGAWPKDLAKFEFKIDHANEKNVVYKYTVVLPVEDIQILLNSKESYLTNRDQIKNKIKQIKDPSTKKLNDPVWVDAMIDGLAQLYETAQTESLSPVMSIQYSRSAFKISCIDEVQKKPVDIQITVDKDVEYKTAEKPHLNGGYKDEERVVEVKIPLEYADFNHPFWRQDEKHLGFLKALAILDENQVSWIEKDKGKLKASEKLLKKDLD